jgi:hypothetical protein
MLRAGFVDLREDHLGYPEHLTLDEVVGSFHSAAPLHRLGNEEFRAYDAELRRALLAAQPDGLFSEEVAVRVLSGAREPSA